MDVLLRSQTAREFFWSPKVIASLGEVDEARFPAARELIEVSVPCAIALSLGRLGVEAALLRPLARRLLGAATKARLRAATARLGLREDSGISEELLEKTFEEARPRLPDINSVKELSRMTKDKVKVEQINSWFRVRLDTERERIKVDRFTECVWRLLVYSFAFFFGLKALSREAWYADAAGEANSFTLDEQTTHVFWENFPIGHTVEGMTKAFYIMIQLPLYLHLLFFHTFVDQRRQDFWEMFAHHILVIILMTFSYVGNFVRVGCVIILCHDITDLFLESSKIFNYLKMETMTVIAFNLFVFNWTYYRMFRFPLVCMRSTFYESVEYDVVSHQALFFFNILLNLLLLLNLYWFRLIMKLWFSMMWRTANVSQAGAARNGTTDAVAPPGDDSTDGDSDSSYLSDLGEESRSGSIDETGEDADGVGARMKRHED